jgi:hypothetical protein
MNSNPFTPLFGNEPPILAGRNRYINDVLIGLENGSGDPNRVTIFTGPRGSGKTVLLAKIAFEAEGMGWIAVHASSLPGMLDLLSEQTLEKGKEFIPASAGSGITGIQAMGVGVTREIKPSPKLSWRTQMGRYVETLNEQGIGLLFTVDEVTSREKEMVTLVDTFQHFVREKRNVALIMAGLPNNVIQIFQHDSISFLRRAFRRSLDFISIPEVKAVMKNTVALADRTITADALDAAATATQGFPFMIQLVGYHMFNQSTKKRIVLTDAVSGIEIARADMENMIIDSTLRELSDNDLKFLNAMAVDEGDSRIADIIKRMKVSAANAGYYRRRLIELGIISSVGRGKVAINLPMLKDRLSHDLRKG